MWPPPSVMAPNGYAIRGLTQKLLGSTNISVGPKFLQLEAELIEISGVCKTGKAKLLTALPSFYAMYSEQTNFPSEWFLALQPFRLGFRL